MTANSMDIHQVNNSRMLTSVWQLRMRSEVVICPDCGAMLPVSSNPESCALCGSDSVES
ncbi:MAG: hypothetical protein HY815_13480 [Candidatus Riflebacteria bacterium]|nr:hypothetical protein [Candidatus Riflebacteria bacterium]